MAINKLWNDYADIIDARLYERLPKAVLAAIAVAYITRLNGDDTLRIDGEVDELLLDEWQALHSNGIVPQAPPPAQGRGQGRRR